jgi:hypothetical protein
MPGQRFSDRGRQARRWGPEASEVAPLSRRTIPPSKRGARGGGGRRNQSPGRSRLPAKAARRQKSVLGPAVAAGSHGLARGPKPLVPNALRWTSRLNSDTGPVRTRGRLYHQSSQLTNSPADMRHPRRPCPLALAAHPCSRDRGADPCGPGYQPRSSCGARDQRYATMFPMSSSFTVPFHAGMYSGGAGCAGSASGGILPSRMIFITSGWR